MSSPGGDHHHGHLDATTDREVVFCHNCTHEWYRDEQGLTCPECDDDIVEIIDPNNDPRPIHHSSASTSPELHPQRFDDDDENDSDPDEADIEQHLGPHGFAFRRSVRDGPQHRHHNPAVDPVLERFVDMIRGLAPPGRGSEETGSPRPGMFSPGSDEDVGQPRIHRATFTSGSFGGGSASVTIVSGPMPANFTVRPRGSGAARHDAFQAIFSDVLRDIGAPIDHQHEGGEGEGEGDGAPPFARSLHDILSLLNPANARAGDVVYSQEALDRIITGLMEANPQSNAAPPATQEALQKLDRKPVNREMLGGEEKIECTICIDEMTEGQTAAVLPCKHWFHDECVVLWLKEHNTCPICRTPIEKSDPTSNNNPNRHGENANPGLGNGTGSGFRSPGFHGSGQPDAGLDGPSNSPWASHLAAMSPRAANRENRESMMDWLHSHPNEGEYDGSSSPGSRPSWPSRPPSHSQSPLNEVFRNLSSMHERNRDRDRDRSIASGFSYDTSRLQRRSSHSPTSPRNSGPGEQRARMRQRSPSQSSRRSIMEQDQEQDQEQRRPSNGPFGWLRDRFGGGSGNNGAPRDGRRQ